MAHSSSISECPVKSPVSEQIATVASAMMLAFLQIDLSPSSKLIDASDSITVAGLERWCGPR